MGGSFFNIEQTNLNPTDAIHAALCVYYSGVGYLYSNISFSWHK